MASQYDAVDVKKVDVAAEPGRFAALGVTAIPAILVNGRLEWVGLPKEAQLRERIEAALGPG
ncbi:MAG: thioredoxin family protein [Candidatus Rokubacteria bacterium]|nr:thioredoxin family protein [Candidatus Rokubacteria bacterium]